MVLENDFQQGNLNKVQDSPYRNVSYCADTAQWDVCHYNALSLCLLKCTRTVSPNLDYLLVLYLISSCHVNIFVRLILTYSSCVLVVNGTLFTLANMSVRNVKRYTFQLKRYFPKCKLKKVCACVWA